MTFYLIRWNGILIKFTKFPKIHIQLHDFSFCYSYEIFVAFSG